MSKRKSKNRQRIDRSRRWSQFFESPENFSVGERKLRFSLYILRLVLLIAVIELGMYVGIVQFGTGTVTDLVDFLKLANEFLLFGFGIVLSVFTMGNVGTKWASRYGNYTGMPGGGEYTESGDWNFSRGQQRDAININVNKVDKKGLPTDPQEDLPEGAPGADTPAPVGPLPVRKKNR